MQLRIGSSYVLYCHIPSKVQYSRSLSLYLHRPMYCYSNNDTGFYAGVQPVAKLLRDNIEDLFMVRIYRSRQKQCVYERGHLSKVAKGKPVAYPGFTDTKKMFLLYIRDGLS